MPRHVPQDSIETSGILNEMYLEWAYRSGSGTENSSPPERTVCMNASVAPLYFLLYSTVQYFSPLSLLSQGVSGAFAAASSSVSGRRVSPSRSFAGHQSDRGRVRLERWTVGCRRALEEDADSFREVGMTFPPKTRRISASGLRCERETDNSLKHSSWGDREGRPFPFKVAELERYVSRYLRAIYQKLRGNGSGCQRLT